MNNTHYRRRHTGKDELTLKPKGDFDVIELVELVSAQTGINYMTTKLVINRAFDAIMDLVNEGTSVDVKNFGIFTTKRMKARTFLDVNTRKKSYYPEHTVVKFNPAAHWQDYHRLHSMDMTQPLPEGCEYVTRVKLAKEGRRKAGITTPRSELVKNPDTLSYFEATIPYAQRINESRRRRGLLKENSADGENI